MASAVLDLWSHCFGHDFERTCGFVGSTTACEGLASGYCIVSVVAFALGGNDILFAER